jgi:hypothetical protein
MLLHIEKFLLDLRNRISYNNYSSLGSWRNGYRIRLLTCKFQVRVLVVLPKFLSLWRSGNASGSYPVSLWFESIWGHQITERYMERFQVVQLNVTPKALLVLKEFLYNTKIGGGKFDEDILRIVDGIDSIAEWVAEWEEKYGVPVITTEASTEYGVTYSVN